MANRDANSTSDATLELFQAAGLGRISRRELMLRGAALGLGAAGVSSLLAVNASAAPSNTLKRLNALMQDTLAADQVVRLPEQEPTRFDPGVTGGGAGLEQLQNIFEGLVTVDQRDGTLTMGIAQKMDVNSDATVFTFTLTQGMTWSDGTPLNAHDFEWSWKRVLDPATRSEYVSAMYPVKNAAAIVAGSAKLDDLGVKATDDNTLEVTLEGPTPYFPLLASTWTFYPVPKHVIDKEGNDAWVEAGKIVSNGPYILTAWEHDQSMVLEINPKYYGPKPTITKANYTLYKDRTTDALVPYENDEVDQAQVPGTDLERIKNDPTFGPQMQVFPRSGTSMLFCDATNPPTDNIKVRQALSMAISRDTLANGILKGEFSPAPTVLPPDIPGNDPTAALGEDVNAAKQLLADAGFPDGKGFPNLKLTYLAQTGADVNSAQYLQGVWKQNLGIDVTLDPLDDKPFQDWSNTLAAPPLGELKSFNLYISLWGSDWGDPANWHNQLFDSKSDLYHTHWKNDEFDSIVRAAAVMAGDAEARIAQYKKAEKILNTDAAIIPLYHLNRIFVIKPYLKGDYHYPILGRSWIKYMSILQH